MIYFVNKYNLDNLCELKSKKKEKKELQSDRLFLLQLYICQGLIHGICNG